MHPVGGFRETCDEALGESVERRNVLAMNLVTSLPEEGMPAVNYQTMMVGKFAYIIVCLNRHPVNLMFTGRMQYCCKGCSDYADICIDTLLNRAYSLVQTKQAS
jgi:hypothetical protein